jgi:hypothetical protein
MNRACVLWACSPYPTPHAQAWATPKNPSLFVEKDMPKASPFRLQFASAIICHAAVAPASVMPPSPYHHNHHHHHHHHHHNHHSQQHTAPHKHHPITPRCHLDLRSSLLTKHHNSPKVKGAQGAVCAHCPENVLALGEGDVQHLLVVGNQLRHHFLRLTRHSACRQPVQGQ